MNKLFLAAVLLAAPLAARADGGLRIGAEANIATHDSSGTHAITDNWPLAGNLMLSYWTPGSFLSLDLELSEQFFLNSPVGSSSRIGTVLRPGVRLTAPLLPVYARVALPINLENANGDREKVDLRLGVGINIPLVLFSIYLEGDADFPLSSSGTGPTSISAFNQQAFWLSGGLDFRF